MNFQQMRVFAVAIERGGMSAASRELGVSPTAVSKQIRGLEELLGTQLIKRSSTRFEVTEAGNLLYENCQRILRDIAGLRETVRSFKISPSGKIRVFSTQSFSETFIVPFLKEFNDLYPEVLVNLDIADRLPDLQKEGIDLCLGVTTHWDPDLIKKKLLRVTECLLAAPSYLKKFGAPKNRDDLLKHRFVCHGGRLNPYAITIQGEVLQIKPSIIINDQAAMMRCALAGMGLVYTVSEVAQSYIESGKLKQLLPHVLSDTHNYYGFYLPTRHLKPATRAFMDFVVSKLSK